MLAALKNMDHLFAVHPLTRNAKISAWRRFIGWQIASRLRPEMEFDWVGKQKLVVRRGMTGATGNIYVGLHEFVEMGLLLHYLRPGDLFLDIGANIGSFTILASGVSGAESWAFEPDPDVMADLKKNVAINKLEHLVKPCPYALGGSEGEVRFTVGLAESINRVATDADKTVRIVPMKTVDGLLQGRGANMFKMDVEGYEEEVLKGAETTLANRSLQVIEVEGMTSSIRALLERHGFEVGFYDPTTRALTRQDNGLEFCNSFLIRDWDEVSARLKSAPRIRILGQDV